MIKIDIEKIGIFRKANPSDIIEGNILFLVGDGDILHRKIVEEVLDPTDMYKGFYAEDGCSYGLDDLYALITNNEKDIKLYESIKTIDSISNIIKNSKFSDLF